MTKIEKRFRNHNSVFPYRKHRKHRSTVCVGIHSSPKVKRGQRASRNRNRRHWKCWRKEKRRTTGLRTRAGTRGRRSDSARIGRRRNGCLPTITRRVQNTVVVHDFDWESEGLSKKKNSHEKLVQRKGSARKLRVLSVCFFEKFVK